MNLNIHIFKNVNSMHSTDKMVPLEKKLRNIGLKTKFNDSNNSNEEEEEEIFFAVRVTICLNIVM